MVKTQKSDKIIKIILKPGTTTYYINGELTIGKCGVFESERIPGMFIGSYSMPDKVRKHIFDLDISMVNVPVKDNDFLEYGKTFILKSIISNWMFGDIRHAKSVNLLITGNGGKCSIDLAVDTVSCLFYKDNSANGICITFNDRNSTYIEAIEAIDKIFSSATADKYIEVTLWFKFGEEMA